MANLLKRKELAALIGKTPQYIGSNIIRGKIIEENKRIDTDNSVNKEFIAKFTNRQIDESSNIGNIENKSEVNNTDIDLNQNIDNIKTHEVEKIKKKHEIIKIQAEVKLKNLEYQKKQAKVLPVDFVVEWFGRNMKGAFSETVNFGNSIIESICNEVDIPVDIKLKYKKKFKQGFNELILEAIKKQLPEAVKHAEEYALINKW